MRKVLFLTGLFGSVFFLSGCGSTNTVSQPSVENPILKATVLKTIDSGVKWETKIKIDDKKSIASINVLRVAIDPFDDSTVYLGSEKNGIFVTKDGADTWSQIKFPEKVYGIVLDHSVKGVIYASGSYKGRAKIFKKSEEDNEWNEIYTEPSENSVISVLAMDKFNSNVIYAGTSEGVILKTKDGGKTWNNLHKADAPVTSIDFDSSDSNIVYFGIFQRALLKSVNGGEKIEDITGKIESEDGNKSVFSVVADPSLAGVIYVGLENGISKSVNFGENWTNLNTIGSSRNFPVRALAINPKNSKEIMYVAGKAIYKSIDNGEQWSTFQLDATKEVSQVVYNKNIPSIIYAGLRAF